MIRLYGQRAFVTRQRLVEPLQLMQGIAAIVERVSNAWAEFAAVLSRTRSAYLEHQAKAELKSLMPEDAKEAIGHGLRAKRSKSGAISFDLLRMEASDAAV